MDSVHADNIAALNRTLGQMKLLLHALAELNGSKNISKADAAKRIETTPVTTKTLASDGGLEEPLKKIGGVLLGDALVTLGATEQPSSVTLERVENNPQVFLGVQDKKGGETKPSLIPGFVSTATYDGSVEDEQEIGGSTDACIILRAPRSKNSSQPHPQHEHPATQSTQRTTRMPYISTPISANQTHLRLDRNLTNDPQRAILLKRLKDAFRIVSRYSDLRPTEVINNKSETMFATKLKR